MTEHRYTPTDRGDAIDDCCRTRRAAIEQDEPTSNAGPSYGEMTDQELLQLGAWVDEHYRRGFLIEESDGTLRPITNFEMYASTFYERHTEHLDQLFGQWVEAFELWAADGCPFSFS